ncbi:hypothetical protein TNCV_1787881 [Trichonephila clavipes]|nr:hypothetical protein TNCV_1787881 [Trichonephila clavipes]
MKCRPASMVDTTLGLQLCGFGFKSRVRHNGIFFGESSRTFTCNGFPWFARFKRHFEAAHGGRWTAGMDFVILSPDWTTPQLALLLERSLHANARALVLGQI